MNLGWDLLDALLYVIAPLAGLVFYWRLATRLRQRGAPLVLLGEIFLLFCATGGLVLGFLIELRWGAPNLIGMGLILASLLLALTALPIALIDL